MIKHVLILIIVVLVSLIPITGHVESSDVCPVTVGTDKVPDQSFPESKNWYGTEALAVVLPPDGIWPTTKIGARLAVKFFWWSLGFRPGMEKNLSVTIRNLDGDQNDAIVSKPRNAHKISMGWMMLTGFDIKNPGCWEITGEYQGESLTFVIKTVDVKAFRQNDT